jgi:ATP phosphoribosyltransferase
VPKGEKYTDIHYFEGKRIATSYPEILRKYLSQLGVASDIHEISGSVEIAPGIGLADGICDIVSSGSTLFTNGLKEVATVFKSEAELIASPGLSLEKQEIIDRLMFRMDAVRQANNNKYILLNAPQAAVETIIGILPGIKSPTVMPLAKEGWVSLHSVISEDDFWEIIEALKAAGAEGILVVPIEKMIN